MSDTPLTDAESFQMPMKADAESPSGWCCVVRAKFARKLERKNAQLCAANARLREALATCRAVSVHAGYGDLDNVNKSYYFDEVKVGAVLREGQ